MRLLMTTDTVGGVWTFSRELTEGFITAGCSICLISVGPPPSPDQNSWLAAQSTSHPDFFQHHHIAAPLEWQQNNTVACSSAAPSLARIASAFKAQVVISGQFCFGDFPLDIPCIVVAHSDVLSWAEAVGRAPLAASAWLETYIDLVRNGLASATAVVAPSQWMLNSLGHQFALPRDIRVIPNGRMLPSAPPVISRKLQAITAGRLWDPAKGISILRDVHSPMPLLVAGDLVADQLATPHGDTGFPPNITFLGKLSEPDLLTRFLQSAAYICTSVYEPFGLAPLEAALSGCAILCRNIPSLREVWGESAQYFTTAAELSTRLDHLHTNSAALEDAQHRARSRAQLFNRDRMTNAYLSLSTELIQQHAERAHAA